MADETNATPAPAPSTAFMTCSECRAPMRDKYYALNDRPICAKCKPAYAKKIARTDGPGAIWRVGFQGLLIAIAGTAVLAWIVSVFPVARIFPLIPIGWLIGKRMMKSLDGYSARRYQYLAVGLTYASFFAGMYLPMARNEMKDRERSAEVRTKMQGTVATQDDQLNTELASLSSAHADSAAPDQAAVEEEDGEPEEADQPAPPVAEERIGPGPGLRFVMLLLFPFFAMLQFGTAFSAVGVLSFGFALYLAWKQTDGQGMDLKLSGPFRVGSGPIPAR